jgi:hypothetical protein
MVRFQFNSGFPAKKQRDASKNRSHQLYNIHHALSPMLSVFRLPNSSISNLGILNYNILYPMRFALCLLLFAPYPERSALYPYALIIFLSDLSHFL